MKSEIDQDVIITPLILRNEFDVRERSPLENIRLKGFTDDDFTQLHDIISYVKEDDTSYFFDFIEHPAYILSELRKMQFFAFIHKETKGDTQIYRLEVQRPKSSFDLNSIHIDKIMKNSNSEHKFDYTYYPKQVIDELIQMGYFLTVEEWKVDLEGKETLMKTNLPPSKILPKSKYCLYWKVVPTLPKKKHVEVEPIRLVTKKKRDFWMKISQRPSFKNANRNRSYVIAKKINEDFEANDLIELPLSESCKPHPSTYLIQYRKF